MRLAILACFLWSGMACAEDKIIAFTYQGNPWPIVMTELCPGNSLSNIGNEVRIRCPKAGEKTPPIWYTAKCALVSVQRVTVAGGGTRANVRCVAA